MLVFKNMSSAMLSRLDVPRAARDSGPSPSPTDLPAFLPYACGQLQAPFSLRIELKPDEVYLSGADDRKRLMSRSVQQLTSSVVVTSKSSTALPPASTPLESDSQGYVAPEERDDKPLLAEVTHDTAGRYVALTLGRDQPAPRLLVRILALVLPLYTHLTRLALRRVALAAATVYDLARLLDDTHVTDLCLDESPVPECNQHVLLERASSLRRLSLDRCELGDEGAARLAAALCHPRPASGTLAVLSLASNFIGDEGASALADALRGNRSLLHLNLADNEITDAGAAALLLVLDEFPLTEEEALATRRRSLEYLQAQRAAYAECYRRLLAAQEESVAAAAAAPGQRRTATKARSARVTTSNQSTLAARALAMTEEMVGLHWDPFGAECTVTRDERLYCRGNLVLCSLNLAYNDLTYLSVTRLAGVAAAQAECSGQGSGLLRVVLAGNPLPDPDTCAELRRLRGLLDAQLLRRAHVRVARSRSSTRR